MQQRYSLSWFFSSSACPLSPSFTNCNMPPKWGDKISSTYSALRVLNCSRKLSASLELSPVRSLMQISIFYFTFVCLSTVRRQLWTSLVTSIKVRTHIGNKQWTSDEANYHYLEQHTNNQQMVREHLCLLVIRNNGRRFIIVSAAVIMGYLTKIKLKNKGWLWQIPLYKSRNWYRIEALTCLITYVKFSGIVLKLLSNFSNRLWNVTMQNRLTLCKKHRLVRSNTCSWKISTNTSISGNRGFVYAYKFYVFIRSFQTANFHDFSKNFLIPI